MATQPGGGKAGGRNCCQMLFSTLSQKSPAGADSASSPHVEAPVERGSVESQLESGPANRKGRLSGQGLSKDGM